MGCQLFAELTSTSFHWDVGGRHLAQAFVTHCCRKLWVKLHKGIEVESPWLDRWSCDKQLLAVSHDFTMYSTTSEVQLRDCGAVVSKTPFKTSANQKRDRGRDSSSTGIELSTAGWPLRDHPQIEFFGGKMKLISWATMEKGVFVSSRLSLHDALFVMTS